MKAESKIKMVARVGFDPLNAVPCTVLHDLVRAQQTKHISEFRFPPDLTDVVPKPNSRGECSTARELVARNYSVHRSPP